MVPNTSELLPEPETPVNTVSRRFGISMLTSWRLFTRAPCTRIESWLSPACSARGCVSGAMLIGSAQLLDADQVARRIAEGGVANPVELVDRLLDDLGAARLYPLEGAVEVGGGQVDAGERALGHHLGDRLALVVGDPGGGGRRVEDDRRAGLAGRADGEPVHAAVLDVVANLEAERVAIEGQRGFRVLVREESCVDRDVHGGHARYGRPPGLLDS